MPLTVQVVTPEREVTVCDDAKEACPYFPGAQNQVHWRFDDPSAATGTEQERLEVYRRVRDEMGASIRDFLARSPQA